MHADSMAIIKQYSGISFTQNNMQQQLLICNLKIIAISFRNYKFCAELKKKKKSIC